MFLLRPKFLQSLKGALKFVVCYSISCLSLDLSSLFSFILMLYVLQCWL